MVLNEVKSCVTTLIGETIFDNGEFIINEIPLDGDEMPISDERISCMICTLDGIDNN